MAAMSLSALLRDLEFLLSILGHLTYQSSNWMMSGMVGGLWWTGRVALALLLTLRDNNDYGSHNGDGYGQLDTGE